MAINAEGAWSADNGGAVFIYTDGEVHPNGPTWQMEPLTVLEALALADKIIKAAQTAVRFEIEEGAA
jgi:hypothetical protein